MFSLKIIDTDLFIDMPMTARLLYYDLAMRADDDGFVASPKKIQRMVGCSDDDLKLLIAKQFIIPFDSGVCVIKHWRIHNYIRGDRHTDTIYQNEKEQLVEKDNVYELMPLENNICLPNDIPNDNQMSDKRYPQVRLGKDSISKDNINNKDNIKNRVVGEEKKKVSNAAKINEAIDTYTKNLTLKNTIIDFINMRKTIKKAMTDKALKLMLNKLDKLSNTDNEKIEILNQSIFNSWQGIFPLKEDGNGINRQDNRANEESPYDFSKYEGK